MRPERLAGDLERDVGALPGREEVTEMAVQVGRRHHKRRRSSRLPPVPDINGDVAPDLETVIHDEIRRRRLHGLSLDENDEPVAAMRVPIPLHATGVGRHLVPRLIESRKTKAARARGGYG